MSSSDGFKFACPYCSQHIKAYDEHIGDVVTCPTCDADIVVPNPYALRKARYVVDEPESPFYSQAELMSIRNEPAELQDEILQIAKENSWEMAVLSKVLTHKLIPLQQILLQYRQPHSFHDEAMPKHEDLFRDIDDRFNRFITILYATYDILLYGLPQAMTQESLVLIMDFGNKIAEQVASLSAYHTSLFEYPLPRQEPYPAIQDIQLYWGVHMNHVLETVARKLNDCAAMPREESAGLLMQTSVIPPNIHQFLVLRQFLVHLIRNPD